MRVLARGVWGVDYWVVEQEGGVELVTSSSGISLRYSILFRAIRATCDVL